MSKLRELVSASIPQQHREDLVYSLSQSAAAAAAVCVCVCVCVSGHTDGMVFIY